MIVAPSYMAAAAEPWAGPDSPFRPGEAYADRAATCETAQDWIDKAPQVDARVTFSIEGELTAIEWDGALAYLVMCAEGGVQVMCVTYSKEGRSLGERVLFGGGWNRVAENKVMLDPCLASPVE